MNGNDHAPLPRRPAARLELSLSAAFSGLVIVGWGAIESGWLQAFAQWLATTADTLHHMGHALHGLGSLRVAFVWRSFSVAWLPKVVLRRRPTEVALEKAQHCGVEERRVLGRREVRGAREDG